MRNDYEQSLDRLERRLREPPQRPLSGELSARVMQAVRTELEAPVSVRPREAPRGRSAVVVATTAATLLMAVLVLHVTRVSNREGGTEVVTIPSPAASQSEPDSLPTVQDYRLALWSSPDALDELIDSQMRAFDQPASTITVSAQALE